MTRKDLDDFVECFCVEDRSRRQETYSEETNPNGRWRKYSVSDLLSRDLVNLDITWMTEAKNEEDNLSIEELLERMEDRIKTIQTSFAELKKELGNEF